MNKLASLFDAELINKLTENEVHSLAAESEHSAAERQRSVDKLKDLEDALRKLKRLDKHRSSISGKFIKKIWTGIVNWHFLAWRHDQATSESEAEELDDVNEQDSDTEYTVM